jgi:hypothetical protein
MISEQLLSLYNHWCIADSVRYALFPRIPPSKLELTLRQQIGDERLDLALAYSATLRMCVLYGLEYVVVEGYRQIGDSFEPIDTLLAKHHFADKLRLFRNAIFHFQQKRVTPKHLGFLEEAGSEIWIQNLHKAFKAYFKARLPMDEFFKALGAKKRAAT